MVKQNKIKTNNLPESWRSAFLQPPSSYTAQQRIRNHPSLSSFVSHTIDDLTSCHFKERHGNLSSLKMNLQSSSIVESLGANNDYFANLGMNVDDNIIINSDYNVEVPSVLLSATTQTVSDKTFEAVAPDTSTLVGFGVILLLSIICGFVWANEVVPVSRTKLAISKRSGEVKEYLDGLKEDALVETLESRDDELTTTNDLNINDLAQTVKPDKGDGRDFERWLFSDWLNSGASGSKPGRQKEPALPILKKAKWNSGDNPVLVASALIGLCVLFASVTERVTSFI